MAAPSDDCNGVVVNRARSEAIDSTRGVPKQLVEERCLKAKIAVRKFMRKMRSDSTYCTLAVGPKSGFLRSFTAMER